MEQSLYLNAEDNNDTNTLPAGLNSTNQDTVVKVLKELLAKSQ